MEISLFKFMFAINLIIFAIAFLYTKDKELQALFSIVSLIIFMGLTVQSLNIELYVYNGDVWETQRITDYELPFGILFIFTIINTLYTFVMILDLYNINKYSKRFRRY